MIYLWSEKAADPREQRALFRVFPSGSHDSNLLSAPCIYLRFFVDYLQVSQFSSHSSGHAIILVLTAYSNIEKQHGNNGRLQKSFNTRRGLSTLYNNYFRNNLIAFLYLTMSIWFTLTRWNILSSRKKRYKVCQSEPFVGLVKKRHAYFRGLSHKVIIRKWFISTAFIVTYKKNFMHLNIIKISSTIKFVSNNFY